MEHLNPFKIDIKVKVVPVKPGGPEEPRVFLTCKCGNNNEHLLPGDQEPFYDFLKTNVEIGERMRKHYSQVKVAICRRCKEEVPHNYIAFEVRKQMEALKNKKK